MAGFIGRCVGDISDAQTFFRGTVKLLEVCDKPDLFSKAKLLITCNKALNASGPTYQACVNKGKTSMNALKDIRDPAGAMEVLRSGRILKETCWYVKITAEQTDIDLALCSRFIAC